MESEHTYEKYHRCFAAINLDAVVSNLEALKGCLSPGVKAMAVVKANAYGHGSVPVSRCIEDRVDSFAVASVDEALELRRGGIKKPILVLSYTSPLQYGELVEGDITASLYDTNEARLLSECAARLGKKAKVHVAVDTGMGRIGFPPNAEGADAVLEISRLEAVELEGLFSHYACADCFDKTDALAQTELFDSFIKLLEERGVNIPVKHICNSAGTMDFKKQYNMCRLGIALYGLYPSEETELADRERVKLTPAMEVISHIIHVKEVPAGFKIGYGHIYEAPSPRRIATVSIGYADGYKRCLTNKGYVLIRGKRAPVVGKVCMDQIMVDVTDIDGAEVGEHAVILGENGGERISAELLGGMCHSFNYEVVCNYMPRVTRVYYRNGKPEEY